jgi:DNA-binding PadR family transcriptional regulator
MSIDHLRHQTESEFTLLGYLFRRPMHAYEIHRHLQSHGGLGLIWNLTQSRVYASLAKLERQDLIVSRLAPQVGRPARRILHLTKRGREAFLAWLRDPVTLGRKMRPEFVAKLIFFRDLEPGEAAALLAHQSRLIAAWLDVLTREAANQGPGLGFDDLAYAFRIRQAQAMLDWIGTCQRRLSEAATSSKPL